MKQTGRSSLLLRLASAFGHTRLGSQPALEAYPTARESKVGVARWSVVVVAAITNIALFGSTARADEGAPKSCYWDGVTSCQCKSPHVFPTCQDFQDCKDTFPTRCKHEDAT